ncbi:zinc finger protein CONSTANS-LIKE 16-like [Lycium barbarum]|uniref:zinc finger protein CONSTANS-LIKE 16-like n=1 Tax=Lycium barbarum TaxID=112863 RepID=UPI00293E7E3B|nr:zinc finger protein CONSTANS-LIKE 16-like [Lycium barbarum]
MCVYKKNRKSKTRNKKRRKPKFLSLSLELSDKKSQPSDHMVASSSNGSNHDHDEGSHQLNLFPLHPENLVDDKDSTAHDENVALFFSGAENSATTLNELLVSPKDEIDCNISTSVPNYMTVSSEEASLTFADTYRGQQGELVRTALRNKERDHREEEKWVVYSDVVEFDQHSETRKDEEVSSCPRNKHHHHQQQQQLSLKLDYDEILNAWSDKGSLYLQAESPQIVPDIQDDFLAYETPFSPHGLMGSSAVLYRVPEGMGSEQSESIQIEEDLNLKAGRREASVMRYKEKRQNRLFSKTIRYQVRKLNAEKRPRVKGRFVKRD